MRISTKLIIFLAVTATVSCMNIPRIPLEDIANELMEKFTYHEKFREIGCNGNYDADKFKYVYDICQQCHKIFGESIIEIMCTKDCFGHISFLEGCVETLQEQDNFETRRQYVDLFQGRNEDKEWVKALISTSQRQTYR